MSPYMRPSLRHSGSSGSRFDDATLSPRRRRLLRILQSRLFNAMFAGLFLANVIVVFLETNHSTACVRGGECVPIYAPFNVAIVVAYTIESVLRIYAYGRSYFRSPMNITDLVIVVLGILDVAILPAMLVPDAGPLRLCRILRLLRCSRLLRSYPELQNMIRSLRHAMKAICWGGVLLFVFLGVFGLITTEFVFPLAYQMSQQDEGFTSCADSFSSVWATMRWFCQTLVAGDSWGECSRPLSEEHPWVFLIFASVLVFYVLGLTNLILTAIVEAAQRSYQDDCVSRHRKQVQQERSAVQRVLSILEQVDSESKGSISYDDLIQGYRDNPELRKLFRAMDLEENDLSSLFRLMDVDGDGHCSYSEFIDIVQKSIAQDVKVQLLFIKLQLASMTKLSARNSREPSQRFSSPRADNLRAYLSQRSDSTLEDTTADERLQRVISGERDAHHKLPSTPDAAVMEAPHVGVENVAVEVLPIGSVAAEADGAEAAVVIEDSEARFWDALRAFQQELDAFPRTAGRTPAAATAPGLPAQAACQPCTSRGAPQLDATAQAPTGCHGWMPLLSWARAAPAGCQSAGTGLGSPGSRVDAASRTPGSRPMPQPLQDRCQARISL